MENKDRKILIAEDDIISRLALKEQLQDAQLGQVFVAKNDEEVFTHLESSPFDIILMDVRLRNSKSGIEIVQKLNNDFGQIPVIFITGNSDSATFNEILETAPHAIFKKPIDFAQLKNAILTGYATKNSKDRSRSLDSDELLSLIYQTAKVGMCVTDNKGNFVRVNKAYCENYGYSEKELLGNSFTIVLPKEHRAMAQQVHDDFISRELTEMPGDWQVQTKTGELKDIFATAGHLVNESGQAFKVTTINDVTERNNQLKTLQKSLREREFLEKEIFHRVKNNLNMVASLFQMQRSRIKGNEEAKSIIGTGISRVRSLAILHEQLYKQGDIITINTRTYLEDLVKHLFENNELSEIIEVDIASFDCDVDTAVSIGLITNELLTNVIKHAFGQSIENAVIRLELFKNGADYTLLLTENGKALPSDFVEKQANSLGVQMIISLVDQLDGKFSYYSKGEFKIFEVNFPASQ